MDSLAYAMGTGGAGGGGEGGGFGAFIPLILMFAIFYFIFRGRTTGTTRFTSSTLVLRQFDIKDDIPDGVFVEIVGRASGLIGWILTVIGFDATTSLKITDKDISFNSSSLFGQINQVAPLPSIASTHCGYSKPLGYLIVGMIFVIGGIVIAFVQFESAGAAGIPLIIIGVILFVVYWLSKKMTITLETTGGSIMGIRFKRSVIENIPVDFEKAIQTIDIINKKIIESQKNYILLRQKTAQKE